jgi:hypothetical protein
VAADQSADKNDKFPLFISLVYDSERFPDHFRQLQTSPRLNYGCGFEDSPGKHLKLSLSSDFSWHEDPQIAAKNFSLAIKAKTFSDFRHFQFFIDIGKRRKSREKNYRVVEL